MPLQVGSLRLTDESLQSLLSEPVFLVIPVFQEEPKKESAGESDEKNEPTYLRSRDLDEIISLCSLSETLKEEGFTGSFGSSLYLPVLSPLAYTSVLLAGIGAPSKLVPYRLHTALTKALDGIKKKDLPRLVVTLDPLIATDRPVSSVTLDQATLQAVCAATETTYHSLEAKEPGRRIERLVIRRGLGDVPFLESVARARARARDLVNMPANLKTTRTLVDEARSLPGAEVTIEEDPEWIRENMPCFYQVGRGSLATDPPKWIHALYRPTAMPAMKIALVGKSVIFDTGGYQVKPDPYMNKMKADMTGGATVLAVMREVLTRQLPGIELHAFCAVTPNKIDSDAMTCDSIVNTSCGKKVEIRHTDAEGRLTLIDAVTMAERENPDLIITIATLTGSASRAVGPRIALMATEASWRDRFQNACNRAGDSVQTLDIVEEDFEDIKSKLDGADINNTGNEKYRGAQTAAAFVFSGLKDPSRPLLHLDIAGGDMTPEEKATGIVVRGLMLFLKELSEST